MFLKDLIKALEKHKVRYAIVGGYAVALHGIVRGTVDIDLVIALNKRSFQQADKAMRSIGLLPHLPVEPDEVFSFREEYIKNRNMIVWTFVNPNNPLEMADILITEDAGDIKTVTKKVYDFSLKLASIPDLIAIKKKAGRQQDIEDIKALEKLL
jgi:predicted nucleotidyltransferase